VGAQAIKKLKLLDVPHCAFALPCGKQVSRVRHGPSNAAAHAFNGLTQALSRLQLTLPFDIYLIRRGRIARVFAAAGVSGVMAGGLCPSPVAVEGSTRLTIFSQRGLHVSIPFRGDLPVIIGERDVAVVGPVALALKTSTLGITNWVQIEEKVV
jgi:hypothetical protein